MTGTGIGLDRALELTRTGDIWLFRGHSAADRAIRMTTNSPVNHVGMSVVIDDLPALIWHAELGRSLPDMWSGTAHRGVQLHNLRDAVMVWSHRYEQQAWLRQLNRPITRDMEESLLRTIARLDGTPSPPPPRSPAAGSAAALSCPAASPSSPPPANWRAPTAPKSSPPPTRAWPCSPRIAAPIGMTRADSGAAIDCTWPTATNWAAKSPSRSPPPQPIPPPELRRYGRAAARGVPP